MSHQHDGAQTPAPGVPDDARKRFTTLQAKAARAGIAVYELADGCYLGARWNLQRELPDLDAVSAWLHMQGVR